MRLSFDCFRFIAQLAIEAPRIGVFRGLAGADVPHLDLPLDGLPGG